MSRTLEQARRDAAFYFREAAKLLQLAAAECDHASTEVDEDKARGWAGRAQDAERKGSDALDDLYFALDSGALPMAGDLFEVSP